MHVSQPALALFRREQWFGGLCVTARNCMLLLNKRQHCNCVWTKNVQCDAKLHATRQVQLAHFDEAPSSVSDACHLQFVGTRMRRARAHTRRDQFRVSPAAASQSCTRGMGRRIWATAWRTTFCRSISASSCIARRQKHRTWQLAAQLWTSIFAAFLGFLFECRNSFALSFRLEHASFPWLNRKFTADQPLF